MDNHIVRLVVLIGGTVILGFGASIYGGTQNPWTLILVVLGGGMLGALV